MRKIPLLGMPLSLLLVAVLIVAALPMVVLAGQPTPQMCWGTVTLDGAPAPLGTTIEIFVGADSAASGSEITDRMVGEYGTVIVTADSDRYGETLTYKVNGFVATKQGDDGIFGLQNQIVNLTAVSGPQPPTWSFPNKGMFPRHLPDNFSGQVVLADLDKATIPPEVQGVYWFDDDAGEWKFWGPGAPGTTLVGLVSGLDADYKVIVTGDCDWNILSQ